MAAQLDIGRTLERILAVYRERAGVLIPLALLLFIPAALLQALAYEGLGYALLVTLLATAVATVATYLYEGMVVQSVRDLEDGVRDHTIGGLARSVLPVLVPVIVASFIAGIGITLGFLLLIVPGLILLTLWALVVPVLVIERPGVLDAFGRSHRLVRGNALHVFAVLVALFLIQLVVTFVFSLVLIAVLGISLGSAVASLVVNTLLVPAIGIAVTVLYLELNRLEHEPAAAGAPAPEAQAPSHAGESSPARQSPEQQSPSGSPPAAAEPPPGR